MIQLMNCFLLGRSIDCGLGLLAKFAANAAAVLTNTQEMHKKKKRKNTEEGVLSSQAKITVDDLQASPVPKRGSHNCFHVTKRGSPKCFHVAWSQHLY